MKEVKEEIKQEIIETKVHWEAEDGTVFYSEEECRQYEESVKGVLKIRFKKLIVATHESAWDLMGGYEDNSIIAVKPVTDKDVDIIIQYLLFTHPWYSDATTERAVNAVIKAKEDKDIILFGVNDNGDEYFINSRKNIIENLKNLYK